MKDNKKIILFFLWKSLIISLVFTEEIAFKHFLFINFSDQTDIKWKLKIF